MSQISCELIWCLPTPCWAAFGQFYTEVPGLPTSGSSDFCNPYCTQECLLGTFEKGALDENCPNAAQHGVGRPGTSVWPVGILACRRFSQNLVQNEFSYINSGGGRSRMSLAATPPSQEWQDAVYQSYRPLEDDYSIIMPQAPDDITQRLVDQGLLYGPLVSLPAEGFPRI
jgi:hypothetical protein